MSRCPRAAVGGLQAVADRLAATGPYRPGAGLRALAVDGEGIAEAVALCVAAQAAAAGLGCGRRMLLADAAPDLVGVLENTLSLVQDMWAPVASWAQGQASADGVEQCYEQALAVLAPASRRRCGVFHTPPALADRLVADVQRALHASEPSAGFADGVMACLAGGQAARLGQAGDIDPAGRAGQAGQVPRAELMGCQQRAAASLPVSLVEPAAGGGALLRAIVRQVSKTSPSQSRQARVATVLSGTCAFELLPVSCMVLRWTMQLQLMALGLPTRLVELLRLRQGDFLQAVLSDDPSLGQVVVVVSNPPYARSARHRSETMRAWLAPYRAGLVGERNLQPLADDYIKFVRAIQRLLARQPRAVAGLITNHTYVRGRLHRSMRRSLATSFQRIEITDLHGNSKIRPIGPRDENVFGIGQGVALSLFCRSSELTGCSVAYRELRGRASDKLSRLRDGRLPPWQVIGQDIGQGTAGDRSDFAPSESLPGEYRGFVSLSELFDFRSVGGKPGDDGVLVGFEAPQLLAQLDDARQRLSGAQAPGTEAARRLSLRPAERPFSAAEVIKYAYRPFDDRVAYYEPEIWTRPLRALYELVDGQPILLTTRIVKDPAFAHVFATRRFPDVIALSNTSSVNCYAFPLSAMKPEALQAVSGISLSAQEAFAYVYAALHSVDYRQRYLEGLRQDFPRIPVMRDPELIASLVARGGRLLSLHLGDRAPQGPRPRFVDGGDRRILYGPPADVERLATDGQGLTLGVNESSYFTDLPKAVWTFKVGGYQVCRKWLLDRRRAGRRLSDADVTAYCDLVARVADTHSIQTDIDALIGRFGGFPRAVRTVPAGD